MKKGFIQLVIMAALVSVISTVFVYKYMPLGWFEWDKQTYGTTVTSIAGTDSISGSRTTINTNFTNLNTGKFELSDWYATTSARQLTTLSGLTSIGTLTTGVWNATAIPVGYGGTGTTSPTTYMVILGNGSLGLTHASSTGTTGQFLTSGGAGAYPSWQTSSVALGDSYSWTGAHTFQTATTTLNATTSITATSNNPIRLNGINYNFSSTQGASSTIATNDGAGKIVWSPVQMDLAWEMITSTSTCTNGTAGTLCMATSTCSAGKVIVGGGGYAYKNFLMDLIDGIFMANYALGNNKWVVHFRPETGITPPYYVISQAFCAKMQ